MSILFFKWIKTAWIQPLMRTNGWLYNLCVVFDPDLLCILACFRVTGGAGASVWIKVDPKPAALLWQLQRAEVHSCCPNTNTEARMSLKLLQPHNAGTSLHSYSILYVNPESKKVFPALSCLSDRLFSSRHPLSSHLLTTRVTQT